MRCLGLSVSLLLSLLAGQARAQTDEAPPVNEVPPAAEPAPPAETPAAPPPAASPPVASPPVTYAPPPAPPSPSNTPVYILPSPGYTRPAPPPESFAPRGSPLQGYAPPPAYTQPSYAPQQYAPQYPPQQYAPPQYAPPPVYTLPPLPPGYTYVPVPNTGTNQFQNTLSPGEVARREQLYRELYQVESRLDHLQRDRISTGGPITMMVLSYGATLITTGVALSAVDSAEQIEDGWNDEWHDYSLDADHDGDVDEHDEKRFRKTARVAAGVGAATLTLGIISTVRLVKRVAARRAQRLEIAELSQQRKNLRQQLDYGAAITPGQTGFTLQGKF